MIFETGKAYRTRDGRRVMLQAGDDLYPFAGVLDSGETVRLNRNGTFMNSHESGLDLLGAWEVPASVPFEHAEKPDTEPLGADFDNNKGSDHD